MFELTKLATVSEMCDNTTAVDITFQTAVDTHITTSALASSKIMWILIP